MWPGFLQVSEGKNKTLCLQFLHLSRVNGLEASYLPVSILMIPLHASLPTHESIDLGTYVSAGTLPTRQTGADQKEMFNSGGREAYPALEASGSGQDSCLPRVSNL